MIEKKLDASELVVQNTSDVKTDNVLVAMSNIPQNTTNIQVVSDNSTAHKRNKRKIVGAQSTAYSIAIKCYEEQLPFGEDYLFSQIRAYDKKKKQILCIKHDRDSVTDGVWAVALVKHHYHIYIRCTNRADRFKVNALLNDLGIFFRPNLDDELWKNRGVETISNVDKGGFSACAMYATHETAHAIEDGKELYDITEIVSNLSISELEQVREGYIRVSENRKVTNDELIALDKEARDLGLALKDYDEWFYQLPFNVRKNTAKTVFRDSYDRGIEETVSDMSRNHVTRLCVFIRGEGNVGKTYNATKALLDLGITRILQPSQGSGKFDKLKASTQAIVLDDMSLPNALNMADDRICFPYKRNKGQPPWTGQYLIVTSNLFFSDFMENQCGITVHDYSRADSYNTNYKAMLTRFVICHIETDEDGISHLVVERADLRGDDDSLAEKLKMFEAFQEAFDKNIAQFVPTKTTVSFSHLLKKRRTYDT